MRLSAEQLSDILHSLTSVDAGVPGDTRRAPRIKMQMSVSITPCGRNGADCDARGIPSTIVNISTRGICVRHGNRLEAGEQFILHLPRRYRAPIDVLCTVHHCRPDGKQFTLGAEFTCLATPAPVSADNGRQIDRIRQSILG